MRATYSPSTRGMHHISLRQGLRPFSASRRRTVSPDRLSCPVSLTMASAKRSSVQRARPSGGFAQAVATSKASSLPVSLRSAPGRGSSLSARSRLPSTKRRLVRYTVEPPTATVRAISSSLQPASLERAETTIRPLATSCRSTRNEDTRPWGAARGLIAFASLMPCPGAHAGDLWYEFSEQYLQRIEGITASVGNAKDINAVTHMI